MYTRHYHDILQGVGLIAHIFKLTEKNACEIFSTILKFYNQLKSGQIVLNFFVNSVSEYYNYLVDISGSIAPLFLGSWSKHFEN